MLSPAVVELWTLYSFGVAITLLRTYARYRAVGWKRFAADDYLVWVGISGWLENPGCGLGDLYGFDRVLETVHDGILRPTHFWIGFALVIGSFLASFIVILAACRPFHKYWQIYPDPGNICQPAISEAIVWVTFIANIITDPYLIFIPIPMLWKSSLKLIKKIATTIVLGAGVFVLVCATLKSVFLITVRPRYLSK
ncbi:unnamed protein product [Aspergillus oryzae RIB40]|uniref:DNA, SC023 n=1 Tax=Aspergillus oryzae (strain ATCC 42149 / RIB 40) TaxID=510516 RepID=Q2UGX0_ASPOR|nr:unnamed protein product [Aspergillus oryzae RIB40]BAE59195.1 unnamed protein product [Aspergillus oryzae RIB40]